MAAAQPKESGVPPPKKKRRLNSMFSESGRSKVNFDGMEDVTFMVGNDEYGIESISGNRTVFSMQSSIFKAQLFGKMSESKSEEIVIEDVTPDAFNFVKNYFYCKDTELNVAIVLDVLYASKKYLLVDLECECYKFIEKIDKLEHWWKIIKKQKIKDRNMEWALIMKSDVMIMNSNQIVWSQDDINELHPHWLNRLIVYSSFIVDKEHKIWEMCLKYCKSHCKADEMAEETEETEKQAISKMMNEYFLSEIRFPLLDRDYFLENIYSGPDSYVLNSECKGDVLKSFIESPRLYRYETRFDWRPRIPWSYYHMAEYDIKSLAPGDEAVLSTSKGFAHLCCIDEIEWDSVETKNKFKSVSFKGKNSSWNITNESVEDLFGEMFDPASMRSNITELKQKFGGAWKHNYNLDFAVGDDIEYKDYETNEWKRTKVRKLTQLVNSFWKHVVFKKQQPSGDTTQAVHCWWFNEVRKIAK